jgi:alkylation response protein AidB-like acyl-CoA dehydrogenase
VTKAFHESDPTIKGECEQLDREAQSTQERTMASIDYEVELTEGERAVRETVHRFAEEVMRPAGAELDAMADPQDVIAGDSILWEVFKKHRALGLGSHGSQRRPDARTAGQTALHHQRRAGVG